MGHILLDINIVCAELKQFKVAAFFLRYDKDVLTDNQLATVRDACEIEECRQCCEDCHDYLPGECMQCLVPECQNAEMECHLMQTVYSCDEFKLWMPRIDGKQNVTSKITVNTVIIKKSNNIIKNAFNSFNSC